MMIQETGTMIDEDGELVQFTCCPRCSHANKLVKPRDPGIRMLNGTVYELYMTVCRECGLLFTDTCVEERKG